MDLSCCSGGQCRGKCSNVSDQTLRYAAFRGRAAAQHLTEEANRLLSAISCAPDTCRLLDSNRAVERGLSRALCSELALIDYLYAQTVTRC